MKRFISFFLAAVVLLSVIPASVFAVRPYVNMDFESMEDFTTYFISGQFWVDEGSPLVGYAEAKALQTRYADPDDWFDNEAEGTYTWLEYDATITLALADDDMSESQRHVNLVYCNDNPKYQGRTDSRIYMSFAYDVEERCFRLSDGYNNADAQYMDPVYMEIDTDSGEEFFTLGMSVQKNRLRCYYNDQLIFDFYDPEEEHLIAKDINSPFLFWQEGNFIQVTNITTAPAGSIFADTPIVTVVYGDVTGDGLVSLNDVSKILQYAAGWEGVEVDIEAADVTGDGLVSLNDVSKILQYAAGWEGVDLNPNATV